MSARLRGRGDAAESVGPSPRLGSSRLAQCLLLIALLVFGCAPSTGQELGRWTMTVEGQPPRAIEVPTHLELPHRLMRYRLQADVELDAALVDRELELVLPYLPASARLYVDGAPARALHQSTDPDAYRRTGALRWLIPASITHDRKLSLTLDVKHSWDHSNWLDVTPLLVPAGHTPPVVARNRVLNEQGGWFGLIALSQMGMTYLAVFFWDRRRRAYLWFAIQGLTASYYPAYVLGLTMGWLSPAFESILLAQTLGVASIVSIYFTHEFFGLGPAHKGWLVLLAASLLSPLPAALGDFLMTSHAAPIIVLSVASAITYQLVIGARLVRTYTDPGTAAFFLCCWVALGGSAWIDLLAWIGGGEMLAGARPACVGLGLFGIFQSMLLSRSHFRSMDESDRLNEALRAQLRAVEARTTEIEALNEELRQQVGRRSANILSALANSESARDVVELVPGDVVESRYRVLSVIGSGGMGTVYRVERIHDGRPLALKVPREVRGLALARLAREAQIASRIRHPSIVAIVDADVAQRGFMYLAMELVEGCTLDACEGRYDLAWCLDVLVQIVEGVRALHAQDIIHRDLKPVNVLIAGDVASEPQVKITDFGISRWVAAKDEIRIVGTKDAAARESETTRVESSRRDPADTDIMPGRTPSSSPSSQLTQTGMISGTPTYIAPELASAGAELTPAVDVFSFGVVAYRLLTGKPPHAESPFVRRLAGKESAPHPSLRVHCPALAELSAEACAALDACLAMTAQERPSTATLLSVLQGARERSKAGQRERANDEAQQSARHASSHS